MLNGLVWEMPNAPPNLSCRFMTHFTETVLWAGRDRNSKHSFDDLIFGEMPPPKKKKTPAGRESSTRSLRIATDGAPDEDRPCLRGICQRVALTVFLVVCLTSDAAPSTFLVMTGPEDEDRPSDELPKAATVQPRPRRLSPSEMFPEDEENEAPPDVFDNDVRRSHRQHKQQVDAYARLAKDLVDLAPHKRSALELPAELEQVVEGCVPLRKGARVRELRRIATTLRRVDARALRDQLDALGSIDRAAVQQEKALERWRTRLIEEGDIALCEFVEAYPMADRQQLRQLIRTAGKGERTKGKAVAAYRKLLRELRSATGTSSS